MYVGCNVYFRNELKWQLNFKENNDFYSNQNY